MFAEPCDHTSEERAAATETISQYVRTIVGATFPDADAGALSTTVWALVHGFFRRRRGGGHTECSCGGPT